MILALTPDASLLLLTLGYALICLELNRPGAILPGAMGLLCTLYALASFAQFQLSPPALTLILTACMLLLLGLRRTLHPLVSAAAILALILGFARLIPGEPRVHRFTALVSGLFAGAGTSFLTRIARRARTNKGLD